VGGIYNTGSARSPLGTLAAGMDDSRPGDGSNAVDCDELLNQLSEFLGREERDALCREIEEHLKGCRDCRVVVDGTRKTIMLYQADRATPMPAALSGRLQEALAREYGGRS